MQREHFVRVVEERFCRSEMNSATAFVTLLFWWRVCHRNQPSTQLEAPGQLLLGLFHGVPRTEKSILELARGPDYIVLCQRNIEAVCANEAAVREQIRRTVIHELARPLFRVE